MLRGLYAAAAGMDLQQVVLNVTSNNLANATTPGFKQDRVVVTSFPELLLWHLEREPVRAVGTWPYTAAVAATVTDLTPGSLQETGHATDLALAGDGYFTVETPEGERYTRHGSFRIDGEGYLVTVHGDRVLGEEGPLRVEGPDFTVAGDGTVRRQGATVGRLALARFADPGRAPYTLFAARLAATGWRRLRTVTVPVPGYAGRVQLEEWRAPERPRRGTLPRTPRPDP